MFNGKSILITGGTGSFGQQFVKRILKNYDPKKIVIFSRDEMKQDKMRHEYHAEERLRFFIGDVRDNARLRLALRDIDYVVHAAAMKIVPIAEEDPIECIKTNVFGAMNLIDACIDSNSVKKVIALSTDKASEPINLYGATKLTSDKLFSAANNLTGSKDLKFSIVRYGNVMGSRGSVIPFFRSLMNNADFFPITHEEMTRFMITLDEGIDLVIEAFTYMVGGEIFVKKIPSMKIIDIAKTLDPQKKQRVVGIRPGEKLHECMVSRAESRFTFEFDTHYKISPSFSSAEQLEKYRKGGKPVDANFQYTSDNNTNWMSMEQLAAWLEQEYGQ